MKWFVVFLLSIVVCSTNHAETSSEESAYWSVDLGFSPRQSILASCFSDDPFEDGPTLQEVMEAKMPRVLKSKFPDFFGPDSRVYDLVPFVKERGIDLEFAYLDESVHVVFARGTARNVENLEKLFAGFGVDEHIDQCSIRVRAINVNVSGDSVPEDLSELPEEQQELVIEQGLFARSASKVVGDIKQGERHASVEAVATTWPNGEVIEMELVYSLEIEDKPKPLRYSLQSALVLREGRPQYVMLGSGLEPGTTMVLELQVKEIPISTDSSKALEKRKRWHALNAAKKANP